MKEKEYIVRGSTANLINLPTEILKITGWKINEKVVVEQSELELPNGEKINEVFIVKAEDGKRLIKMAEENHENLKDSFDSGFFDDEAEA